MNSQSEKVARPTDFTPARSQGERQSKPSRAWPLLGIAIIVIATLITYIPAIQGGFIWDDDQYITANRFVRNENLPPMEGLRRVWIPGQSPQYYPVVFSMFWMEFQLWGEKPLGYHLINVLLHIASALLIWRVLLVLNIPGGTAAAWLVAAIFALHPVHVESVAWITERKNVLSTCFYLLAMLAWLRFDSMRETRDVTSHRESWGWYGASLLLFVMALLSKSVTCSLPAALILVMLYQRKAMTATRLLPLAPMFVIGLILALHTASLEREHVGAEGPDWDFSLAERFLIASKCLLFYPWKLLWPHPVMFVYPRWEIDGSDVASYWSIVVVALVICACIALWVKKGVRGPFIALSFYAGTVFPAIGFFNVYPHRFSFVADHFVYPAGVGVLALFVSAAMWLARASSREAAEAGAGRRRGCAVFVVVSAIVLASFGALSFVQAGTYKDAETVYRDTIAKNPGAWLAQVNLASRLLKRAEPFVLKGARDQAMPLITEAIERARIGVQLAPHVPQSHTTLAESLRVAGRYDEALEHQQRGIAIVEDRLEADSPAPEALAMDYFALGRLHHLLKQFDETERAFARAIEITPDDPLLRFEMAQFLARQNRLDEALPHYDAVLEVNPADYVSLMMKARIAKSRSRDLVAREYFHRALMASTDAAGEYSAASELALLLAESEDELVRNDVAAMRIIEGYVELTRREAPGLLDVLAAVHFAAGRTEQAIAVAEEAAAKARAAGAVSLAEAIERRLAEFRAAGVGASPDKPQP